MPGRRSPIRSLPKKVEEGRIEDIRECIGCNICITGDMTMSIIAVHAKPDLHGRMAQRLAPRTDERKGRDRKRAVVGAGPAGLEAALALASAAMTWRWPRPVPNPGGRVALESRLPGLSAWGRVRDYRDYQLSQLGNVETYLEQRTDCAGQVLDFGFDHVAIATGASWRRDGVARQHVVPMAIDAGDACLHAGRPDGGQRACWRCGRVR